LHPAPRQGVTRRSALAAAALTGWSAEPLNTTAASFEWQAVKIATATELAFRDVHDRPSSLEAFRGRPVLLNIWATWCAPCILELPALDRLQRDIGRRITVVALSVDREGVAAVLHAAHRLHLKHLKPYVDPTGAVVGKLGLVGLPASLAIAPSGAFLQQRRGRVDWDDPQERRVLERILEG
jgi:thiol-disulfide isomerase/thioredoxin